MTELDISNFHTWFVLALFIISIFFVIVAPKLPIIIPTLYWLKKLFKIPDSKETTDEKFVQVWKPKTRKIYIPLDMSTVPIFCIILMLCTTTLSFKTMWWEGIIGLNQSVKPYNIVILFMALAYVCISLDATGLFEYLARLIVVKTKGNGKMLFFGTGTFASILTLFTSNDVVILTLTPIMCYMGKGSKNFNPIPFVVGQFFLANIMSVALVIGNPTNIIVAEAYQLNFANYSAWMIIPAISATLFCFFLLFVVFWRQIPKQIDQKETSVSSNLDIIAEPQVQAGLRDAQTDNVELNDLENAEGVPQKQDDLKIDKEKNAPIAVAPPTPEKLRDIIVDKIGSVLKSIGLISCLCILAAASFIKINGEPIPLWIICLIYASLFAIYDLIRDIVRAAKSKAPLKQRLSKSVHLQVLYRMPWAVVPFVLGMFIFVQALKTYGWISLLASGLSWLINVCAGKVVSATLWQRLRAVSASVLILAYTSAAACNILNNQPMTILFTYLLQDPNFKLSVGNEVVEYNMKFGAMLALILGSNLGANITLIGALAGIMWKSILNKFGITGKQMNYWKFLKYGLLITPWVILLPSMIIVAEQLIVWK